MREVRRPDLVAAIGKPCAYCGEPMDAPTRDHVRPRRHGGKLTPDNKVLVCDPCNVDKGHRSLEAWLERLRRRGDRRAEIVASLVHRDETADGQGNA